MNDPRIPPTEAEDDNRTAFYRGDAPPEFLSRLPDLEIGPLVGQGGMGQVYRARNPHTNRQVAVKVLAHAGGDMRRFSREMQSLAELDHPNIVRVLHGGAVDGRPYMVMELLDGESLHAYERTHHPLPVSEACDLIRQAARGLQHAHDRGLIHRDIKPGNLLRTRSGQVKVLDLGLVGVAGGSNEPLTGAAGVLLGTPGYIAPEQADDPRAANPATDVFSLGCTLYFLLTGESPFPGATTASKIDALKQLSFKRLAEVRPDCPRELSQFVASMLHRQPEARPRSMAIVDDRLRPFCVDASRQTTSRISRGLIGAAVALVILVASGGVYFSGIIRSRTPVAGPEKTLVKPVPENLAAKVFGDGPDGEIANMGGFTGRPLSVRFSPNYEFAVASEGHGSRSGFMECTRLWDLTKRNLVRSWGYYNQYAEWTPDGKRVASFAAPFDLVDPLTGKAVASLKMNPGKVIPPDYSFSRNGESLVVAEPATGFAQLWDMATRKQSQSFKHGVTCTTAAFTHDQKQILTGGDDNTVRLWDIETGRQERSFEGHESALVLVRPLADGKSFVSIAQHRSAPNLSVPNQARVIVWDSATRRPLQTIGLEHVDVLATKGKAFGISAESQQLMVGHSNGMISVWDLRSGAETHAFEACKKGPVTAVDVTPDGRFALSAGQDFVLRLWRLPRAGRN